MVSAALIFITIYEITVVPGVGVSASGSVGVGIGIEKVGRLRAQRTIACFACHCPWGYTVSNCMVATERY